MDLVNSKYFVTQVGDGSHSSVCFNTRMSVSGVDMSKILPEAIHMVGKAKCWPVARHPKKKDLIAVLFSPPIFGNDLAVFHQDWMWISEKSIKTI